MARVEGMRTGTAPRESAQALRAIGRALAGAAPIVALALAWEAQLLDALDASEYRDLNRIIEKLARRLDEGAP